MGKAGVALIVGALTLTCAGSAHAGTVPYGGYFPTGPALAGADTVWTEGDGQHITVKRAPADGPVSTVSSTLCGMEAKVAASDKAIAALAGGCDGTNVVQAGTGATLSTIESSSGGFAPTCDPTAIDVDGSLVAVARNTCAAGTVAIHDLAGGTTSTPTLGLGLPFGISLRGKYLAVGAKHGDTYTVTVYDRDASAIAYALDLTSLISSDPGADHLGVAVESNGTVVVRVGTTPTNSVIDWASLADQTWHKIPGAFGPQPAGFAAAGDLVASSIQDDQGPAIEVVDFSGAVKNRIDPAEGSIKLGVAFDGKRIAWLGNNNLLHNEAYPFEPAPKPTGDPKPPAPLPTATPTPAPTAGPVIAKPVAHPPAVKAGKPSTKLISGTASDADGDLVKVQVAVLRKSGRQCQALKANGKLGAAGKQCTPKAYLTAKGTAKWSLKLKKALPKGSYTLYVLATDKAGHASQTKLAFKSR